MIDLNDLLTKAGLDPAMVIVMCHRPTEMDLRAVLPYGDRAFKIRELGLVEHTITYLCVEPLRA